MWQLASESGSARSFMVRRCTIRHIRLRLLRHITPITTRGTITGLIRRRWLSALISDPGGITITDIMLAEGGMSFVAAATTMPRDDIPGAKVIWLDKVIE